jgi:hypothetical protein
MIAKKDIPKLVEWLTASLAPMIQSKHLMMLPNRLANVITAFNERNSDGDQNPRGN